MAEEERRRPQLLDDPEDPFARICDVELSHLEGCEFDVLFRTREGELLTEEPMAMGPERGAESVSVLNASATYCMASSLTYYLAKMRVVPESLTAHGHVEMELTDQMYRRISKLHIDMDVVVAEREMKRLMRALERFTDLCIVTESIKGSFPIVVRVKHPWGVHMAMSE